MQWILTLSIVLNLAFFTSLKIALLQKNKARAENTQLNLAIAERNNRVHELKLEEAKQKLKLDAYEKKSILAEREYQKNSSEILASAPPAKCEDAAQWAVRQAEEIKKQ